MLQLTEVHLPGNSSGTRTIRLNPHFVATYREPNGAAGAPSDARTWLTLIHGNGYYVAETPDEIDQAIERLYTSPVATIELTDEVIPTDAEVTAFLEAHPEVAQRLATATVTDPQLVEVDLDDMDVDVDATEAERGVRLVIERRDQGADLNAWTQVYELWDRGVPSGTFPDYRITPGP